MTGVLVAFLGIAASWAVAVVVLLRWRHPLRRPEQLLAARTLDGWALPIEAHHPNAPRLGAPPLILAHGLTMGRACWQLSPEGGLLGGLLAAGYTVWIPSYRGDSDTSAPSPATRWSWSFEDHSDLDAPAILDAVTQASAGRTPVWIGHSMGGMIGYVHGGRSAGASLRALVTIGSPMLFGHVPRGFGAIVPALRRIGRIPLRALAVAGLPGAMATPSFWAGYAVRFDRIGFRERLTFFGSACRDTSGALLAFFADVAVHRKVLCAPTVDGWEGAPAWEPGVGLLSRLKCPVLVIAGEADHLAPPDAAIAAATIGGVRFQVRSFGPEGDGGVALGHQDLLSSADSRARVLPALVSFLHSLDEGSAASERRS